MSIEERLLVHFVIDLKQREMLKKKSGSEQYTIPTSLLATLRSNAFTLLMSPKLTSYSSKDLSKATVEASREIGVPEIPAVYELGKLEIIQKTLKKHFTDIQYQIKDKLSKALAQKKQPNIATLSATLIGDRSVPITVALYRRVAALRFVATSHPKEFRSEEFWAKVDEVIEAWKSAADGNAEVLLSIFEQTYKEDVETHGDPAKSGIIAVRIADVPLHQQILDNHASKVKYKRPRTNQGSRKRRRVVEDSEDEPNSDDGGDNSRVSGASAQGTPVPAQDRDKRAADD
ncbi:hypothetical protein K435DRAFT_802472 [Dendrothele bispora CBS 962.96]|uniref:Uncharacterized protein n=1 Tax=Dendrothele bispora (strain CBS 962.96) TaxID=1314807 RepID=A0A4S8LLD8_DENBC|nr:hypothetical protein K435DRAFT_802472 [Dendrothele bispora CBS 962.96]